MGGFFLLLMACDGSDSEISATQAEICAAVGYDTTFTWYWDTDGDGYGDPSQTLQDCIAESGWVLAGNDCGPEDPAINPAAVESCNSLDDDCDGLIDEDFDLDQDEHLSTDCTGDDCDDRSLSVHPGVTDLCEDGFDTDCDGIDPACVPTISVAESKAKIYSDLANFEAGRLIELGDTNLDGNLDILLSTLAADNVAGGAYLLPGPLTTSSTLELVGHRLSGDAEGAGAGRSLALGDITGDGIEDIAVGAPFGAACAEWIVPGPLLSSASLLDSAISLTSAPGSFCGHGSDIVDINGDGVGDAIIGAYADGTGGFESGSVYIQYGPLTAGNYTLEETAGAKLVGEGEAAWTGRVARGAVDLDGDGLGDILASAVGSSPGGPSAGAVYVVYGAPAETISLSDADGRLIGEAPYDYAGIALASGDINGDGLSDVAIGAQSSSVEASAGAAYVIFGPAAGDLSLGSADIIVRGKEESQLAGAGLAIGELDGDTGAELLIGAPGDSGNAGAAYLFANPTSGNFSTTDADIRVLGTEEEQLGWGLAIGDLDRDGVVEVVLGAPANSSGGASGGAIYLFSF